MEISRKALVALFCVLSLTVIMGAYAATVVYNIKFNGSTAITDVPVQVDVNGVVSTDKSSAPVGSVVTVSATLSQALANVPIQFTKNGVNYGAPALTNVGGVATVQYTILPADSGTTITWGALDRTF